MTFIYFPRYNLTNHPVSQIDKWSTLESKSITERKRGFLETCFNVFCEHGLENTSLKMLAEACGVTNGNLIYHFGSKDNIIIESTAFPASAADKMPPAIPNMITRISEQADN